MAPSIEELLASHYDELRTRFLARTRWLEPYYDTEDAFHEWCIRELNHWRREEPTPDRPLYEHLLRRMAHGFWRLPWWRSPPPPSRPHLQKLLTFDATVTPVYSPEPRIEDIPYEPHALRAVAEHLQPRDLELLLCLRETSSISGIAARLDVTEPTINRRLRNLGSKLRRMTYRIQHAVRFLLRGRAIFLSSTYADLHLHRAAVLDKVHKLAANGLPVVVFAMEYLMTGPKHPGDRCLQLVHRSDVYVGLFARRYGSIWSGRNMSFTEAELREAEQLKTHRCIYIPESEHAKTLPTDRHREKRARIDALRKYLGAYYVVERFNSPEALAALVGDQLAAMHWEY